MGTGAVNKSPRSFTGDQSKKITVYPQMRDTDQRFVDTGTDLVQVPAIRIKREFEHPALLKRGAESDIE